MECKLYLRRGLALLLILALLACACPIRQDAAALAGIDDIAIIAALLASLGISLVVHSVTETALEALAAKMDEYGETQGMAAGQFAESIVAQTSIRGPRILQLAKAGWQALTGFINYLKTEQGGGLSVQTPIIHGTESVVIGGISYENCEYLTITKPLTTAGVNAVYPIGNGYSLKVQYVRKSGNTYDTKLYTVKDGEEDLITGHNGPDPLYAIRVYHYSNTIANVWRFQLMLSTQRYPAWTGAGKVFDIPYTEDLQVINDTDWQINDDNFDLSYLNDAVTDIYIRLGSIEGDLDTLAGIAQGVVDAYDSSYAATGVGTITATATTADIGAAGDYATPALSTFFPFCIPFDIYAMVTAFAAEPVAPVVEIPFAFTLPGQDQTLAELDDANELVIDLSEFDAAAQVLRSLEYVLFCIGLALLTRKVIKW